MGDDQIGRRIADEVGDEAALVRVRGRQLAVRDPERGVAGARDLGGAACLVGTDPRDLLRAVDEAAPIAFRGGAHDDGVALGGEACERPSAEDLEIVGVRADRKDLHTASLGATSNSRSSTA